MKKFRENFYPGRGGVTICAEAIGVHHQQWRDWESGKKPPSAKNQQKIASFLGLSVTELRGEMAAPVLKASGNTSEPTQDRKIIECLRSASAIRQYLDKAQDYMLQGELSSDDFLTLANSVISAIQDATTALDKIHEGSNVGNASLRRDADMGIAQEDIQEGA